MKFIKKVFGVPSLMALATVTAFGSGRSHHSSNSSVTITSPSTLPSGVVSTFYSTSLTASGGTTPYAWAVKGCSGACNTGLGFTSSGIMSGMPANAGTSTFTLAVTDAGGRAASASLNLTIATATTPAPTPTPTPTPTTGNVYYVSPTGSDSNPCTQDSPCATPDYTVNNKAVAGDTVLVAAGTYDYGSSEVHFTSSGTAGNYITLTCATRGACKIQNSVTGNSTVVYLSGSYITFDGFEVTNTSSAGNNLGMYVTNSFVNITRNTIHHIETDCSDMGGGGIVVAGSGSANYQLSNITIDSNLVYDISMANGVPRCNSSVVQTDGILDENNANYNVITNNIVYWVSGGWGISSGNGCCTGGTVVGNQVSNNLVFSTARGGILAGESAGVFLTNNIIVDAGLNFGACAYMLETIPPITYANNDLFNNGGGNYCANWGTSDSSIHAGDIAVDPASGTTFVNWQANGSGDYHEKAGSPTIGAGSTAGTPPNHDFDGNPRPATGIDMGPYQNHQ